MATKLRKYLSFSLMAGLLPPPHLNSPAIRKGTFFIFFRLPFENMLILYWVGLIIKRKYEVKKYVFWIFIEGMDEAVKKSLN